MEKLNGIGLRRIRESSFIRQMAFLHLIDFLELFKVIGSVRRLVDKIRYTPLGNYLLPTFPNNALTLLFGSLVIGCTSRYSQLPAAWHDEGKTILTLNRSMFGNKMAKVQNGEP